MDKPYLQGSALEPIPTNRPVRALFSRAGFSALGFLFAAQVSGFLVVLVYQILFSDNYAGWHFLAVASLSQYIFALPICYLVMRGAEKIAISKRKIKTRYLFAAFAVMVLLAQAGSLIGTSFSSALSELLGRDVLDPLSTQVGEMSFLENILILAVAAPIFEELLFRKFLLDRITRYGNGAAVFASAFLFGAIHCNIYQFFYAFFIGILLGYLYVKSGRIRYPILLHGAFNLLLGVLPSLITENVESFTPALIAVNIYQALFLLYVFLQWTLVIIGIIVLYKMFGKIRTDARAYSHNLGSYFSCVMLNPGFVLSFLTSIILFFITVLSN